MKTCNKCQSTKEYSQFSKHPTISDGYYNQCKSCRLKARKKRESERFNPDFSGSKTCKKCNESKLKHNFLLNKSSKDGFNGWCKRCTKDSTIKNKYSISLEDYKSILNSQNNKCAICSTSIPGGPSNKFVIDHCHKTNKVRGLLCNRCNTGLGKLGDTVESLERALEYLKFNSDKIEAGE